MGKTTYTFKDDEVGGARPRPRLTWDFDRNAPRYGEMGPPTGAQGPYMEDLLYPERLVEFEEDLFSPPPAAPPMDLQLPPEFFYQSPEPPMQPEMDLQLDPGFWEQAPQMQPVMDLQLDPDFWGAAARKPKSWVELAPRREKRLRLPAGEISLE